MRAGPRWPAREPPPPFRRAPTTRCRSARRSGPVGRPTRPARACASWHCGPRPTSTQARRGGSRRMTRESPGSDGVREARGVAHDREARAARPPRPGPGRSPPRHRWPRPPRAAMRDARRGQRSQQQPLGRHAVHRGRHPWASTPAPAPGSPAPSAFRTGRLITPAGTGLVQVEVEPLLRPAARTTRTATRWRRCRRRPTAARTRDARAELVGVPLGARGGHAQRRAACRRPPPTSPCRTPGAPGKSWHRPVRASTGPSETSPRSRRRAPVRTVARRVGSRRSRPAPPVAVRRRRPRGCRGR